MTEREAFLFGIDIDGTLLNPAGAVSDRTKRAVHAVLQAGHRVAFATGRNYIEARRIFDIIDHHDLAVLVSGAIVTDTRAKKTIRRSTMDPLLAGELCAAIELAGHAAVALQDREYTGVDYLASADRPIYNALSSWMTLSDQVMDLRQAMSQIDHAHTLRISTVLDYTSAAELKQIVEREFAGRAYVHGVIVPSEGVEIVEIFDPNVNKWLGLTQVAEHHGIARERIIAVGDDQNDLPMIRNATLGVAMGNARSDVKLEAKKVIGSNIDDGLAAFLEEWLASRE